MTRTLILAIAALSPLLAPALTRAGPAARPTPSKPAVDVPPGVVDGPTARELVAAGVKPVDVRTPAEFAAGHVPGAVNIPYDQMDARFGELGSPTTKLLLYCRTGHRSGIAIETLRRHGFTQLFDMKAYDAWVQSEPAQH